MLAFERLTFVMQLNSISLSQLFQHCFRKLCQISFQRNSSWPADNAPELEALWTTIVTVVIFVVDCKAFIPSLCLQGSLVFV